MSLFDGDPTCRFCRTETETEQHIICRCEALAGQRYNVSGEADCRTKRHKHSFGRGPLPLHTNRRVMESVLNGTLGLNNKPKAAVRWVHKVTGPEKKKEEEKYEEKEEEEEKDGEEEEEKEKKNIKMRIFLLLTENTTCMSHLNIAQAPILCLLF